MKLFEQHNLSIQNYITKSASRMVSDKQKSFAFSFTKGKSLTQQYQPMEGLYKLTYNGEAPKKESQPPCEESDTHVTEEYHVKRNKICPKELI